MKVNIKQGKSLRTHQESVRYNVKNLSMLEKDKFETTFANFETYVNVEDYKKTDEKSVI